MMTDGWSPKLVGTWTLISWKQKKSDGTKVQRFGENPVGIAFFDTGGRYIISVMRSDRAKYASDAPWQGRAEEDKSDGRRDHDLLRNIFGK
jgi:Lipocalin-like domain